jgi:hypothetical protein
MGYIFNRRMAKKLIPVHDIILPMQTQAAFALSGGDAMKAQVGISGHRGLVGKEDDGVLFGSDATRVPDREAGQNKPGRFITKFPFAELKDLFSIGLC